MTKLSITYQPIDALNPRANNPRTHSPKQIAQLVRSMQHFGFTNPVLVDDANGIIAGHGRVLAAKELGLMEVPTVRLSGMSDADIRAYVMADNKLAENAGWDEKLLGLELQYLSELDIDFDVSITGFELPEMDAFIDKLSLDDHEDPADEAMEPMPEQAVTRPGNVWRIGNHRLICGDSTKEETYQLLLGDERAQMVFCDAPFNVPINGHVSGLGKIIGTKNKILIARDVKLAPTRDGSKVVVGSKASDKNMQLIKAITRSFLWNEQLLSGEKRTVRELGLQENIKAPSYVTKVMHLRFLAPDIIESIIDGTHPADWTVEKLFAINSTNWPEQRKALGLN